jgi:hypothetical protein
LGLGVHIRWEQAQVQERLEGRQVWSVRLRILQSCSVATLWLKKDPASRRYQAQAERSVRARWRPHILGPFPGAGLCREQIGHTIRFRAGWVEAHILAWGWSGSRLSEEAQSLRTHPFGARPWAAEAYSTPARPRRRSTAPAATSSVQRRVLSDA